MGSRALTTVLLVLLGFGAGLGTGFYLFNRQVPEKILIERSESPENEGDAVIKADAPVDAGTPFQQLEAVIISAMTGRDYARAVGLLQELDILAVSRREEAKVLALLEEAIRLRVVQLESRQRMADIDALYESMTLNMPERAEYFLMLAEHRIRMGLPESALPVLAQIENHHQLGGRAREIIVSLSAPEGEPPLGDISLTRRGNQYLVDVTVDGSASATLMLDTGASTTILSPGLVGRLGYQPDEREARFSTAGGLVTAPVIEIESLAVEDASTGPLTVGVISIAEGQVDGLLGMDFLSRFDYALIRDQDQLVLRQP